MAEKIIIAELDIDSDALAKKNAVILGQITELKEGQKGLRKETDNLNDASDDQLKTYAKTDAQLKKLNKEYNDQKTVLAETTTGVKNLSNALDKEIKTVKDAQVNNSKLIKLRSQVNTKTKEGSEAIVQINKKIGDNNKVIKDNSSALEQQRLNIGNYESALDSVIPGLGGVINGIKGTATSAKASIGSLKAFKIALISTGIGAIVVALGLLVSGFLSTAGGANKMNKVMAQISATISVLTERYLNFIKGWAKFFTGDFTGGLDQMKSSFEGVTDAIKETISEAGKLADLKILNAELARSSNLVIAGLEQEREKYEQLRDDSTRSFLVRENASRKLMETEKQIAKEKVALRTRELGEIATANGIILRGGAELTSAQKDQYTEAVIAFKEAQTEQKTIALVNEKERRTLVQDRLEKDLDILIDGFDNQKSINERKIADERLTFEKRTAILEETVKLSDDSLAKQVETIQKFTNKRIDINDLLATSDAVVLNEKIRLLGLSEIIEGRLLEVIRDRRTAEADLAEVSIDLLEKQLAAEVEIEKQREQLHLDTEASINEKIAVGRDILFRESVNQAEEEGASKLAIKLLTINEEERLAKQQANDTIENKIILERELALIEEEYREEKKEAITLSEEEILTSKIAAIEAYVSIAGNLLTGLLNSNLARTNIELDNATDAINAEFDAKFKAAGDNAGQIQQLEKEKEAQLQQIDIRRREAEAKHAQHQKALAITQAIIQTALSVIKASPIIPLMVFAGIAGAAQIALIAAQPIPKFAKGTKRIKGYGTETSDSVPALLSKNERVVDAKNNHKIGFDLSNDQLATAAQMYRSFSFNGGMSQNNTGLIEAINKNTQIHKNKRASQTTVHVSDGLRAVNESKYLS